MAKDTEMTKTRFGGVYQRNIKNKRFNNRPDIAYEVAYRVNGKLKWKTVGYKSDGMNALIASHKRADLMRKVDYPIHINTIGSIWEELWKDKLQFNKSAKDTMQRWNKHLAHLKDIPIASITKNDLSAIVENKMQAGLSPQTIKHIFNLITRIYNYASSMDIYTGKTPIKGVSVPTIDSKRHRYLTKNEAKKLIEDLKSRSRLIYEIAMVSLHSGLRAGEIFSLTGDKVNLAERLIIITDSKTDRNRVVPLSRHLIEIFKSKNLKPGELVFKSRTGERIKEVSNAFSRAVDSLGFNDGITDRRGKVVFHTLRHTYASWLVIEGVTIHTVAELLGHSSIEMTRRYAHLSPAIKKASIEKIENFWDDAEA